MRILIGTAMLLALGACHRQTADVTLDADADARNVTAQRTLGDIAAADAAARAPMPAVPHKAARAAAATEPAVDAGDDAPAADDINGADTAR
ncbi:hypothetical protein [Sphingomonas nostoxanthinifaciens]|uniref:hypothetical protein n=1 Tax=Sphingomonas nostoxanthinifaciens TaxID=2872652 RepID=UPI001CC1C514|nr:hypothetical protein [Sphingomonas nostoxanthinifaciens]UAK24128.1 hypothetical protein K8P63_17630 [Sphingomonas nostoxanthinifaciens]